MLWETPGVGITISNLLNMSLVRLRGIAQSLQHPDVFSATKADLAQFIELKQEAVREDKTPPATAESLGLVTKLSSRITEASVAEEYMQPFVAKGLSFRTEGERWYMRRALMTDEGPLRMPLRNIVKCAEAFFK